MVQARTSRFGALLFAVAFSAFALESSAQSSYEQILRVQERLEALGFAPGPLDGQMGPKTRAALSNFQQQAQLPLTGEPDAATLSALFSGNDTGSDVAAPSTLDTRRLPEDPQLFVDSITIPASSGAEVNPQEADVAETKQYTQAAASESTAPLAESSEPRDKSKDNSIRESGGSSWLWGLAALFGLLIWRWRHKKRVKRRTPYSRSTKPIEARDTQREPTRELSKRADIAAPIPPVAAPIEPPSEERSFPAKPERGVILAAESLARKETLVRGPSHPPIPKSAPARWVPEGESTVVAGRDIGGMIYVGQPTHHETPHNALIDQTLPVASRADDTNASSMPYWPSYSAIAPRARATYLQWLASGRSDPTYNVGYVFLYFYGLERRFCLDSPDDAERQAIVSEVERLVRIYGENGSVRRYLGTFLDVAQLLLPEAIDLDRPVFERSGWELALRVRVVIGALLAEDRTVPAEWMLSWLMTHPEVFLRTPAARAFPEFKALFVHRFNERFPDGLKVARPKRKLAVTYQAASGGFRVNLSSNLGSLPDIAGLTKPVEIAREVAEGAVDELDRFSRYIGRNPEGRGTIEAYALLPTALKPLFPCTALEDLRKWLTTYQDGFVPIVDLLHRLEDTKPERLSRNQLIGAADALAMLGIGYAPDPRFSLRGPKIDQKVKLFSLPDAVPHLEEASAAYQALLLTIAVGSFIAHADGTISDLERRRLEDRIEKAPSITASERARLLGNLEWSLATPPDFTLLKRNAKDVTADLRHEFGQFALLIAGADGHIDPKEIEAIRRLYGALGLDAGNLYGELHALAADPQLVTVYSPSATQQEYAIPTPPQDEAPTGLKLDTGRIQAIMVDTSRVSSVLHAIFAEDDAAESEAEDLSESLGEPVQFEGLDHKHRSLLLELLRTSSWSSSSFEKLAAQFNLLPGGALEVINEWAFDRFDEALLEEADELEINPSIAAQLAI